MNPEQEIRRRIQASGPVTFAEFMETALYWPSGGYYSYPSGAEPFGASGDYYTSPMAHPVFGALLALQLYQCWRLLDCPDTFHVVELGAGNGLLCRDILSAASGLPGGFARCLRYLCIDRRSSLLNTALNTIPNTVPDHGQNLPGAGRITAAGVPLRNLRGCVLSNELLDAFPVHQVRQERGRLWEVYITLEAGNGQQRSGGFETRPLTETLAEPSSPALAARLAELGIRLAEGQTAEINLGLDAWAGEVAAALSAGLVLTIDYGRPAAELYDGERRPRGTLTAFYRHVQTDAPLRRIGRQDLTAQVDFSSVANAGRRVDLLPLGFTTQRQFLHNLGLDRFRRRLAGASLPQRQAEANRAGLLALARSGGLGDFKVLAQGKNVGRSALWGFEPGPATELAGSLPVPLLTDRHLSLPSGWPAPAG